MMSAYCACGKSVILKRTINSSIHASIHPRRLHKFRNKLKEGNIFSITAFDVKQNLNCYQLTDHPYKIYFNDHTALEDVNGGQYNIPHEYFHIRPFADLGMMKVDETTTPPKTSLNLTLTCTFDVGETVYISVSEKLVRQLSEELVQLKEAPLLVIATSVNSRAVGGKLDLIFT
ncbi:unnamed protein product [Arabis nemorensis]|uniref:Replication protein A 70 kDa DNA-binding subunit B/D first OB fold domain-containing protein n=1 Tax=Arabis nemorensis TaxID=586526 RepID=A0A565BU30_9BRAS|nr:unnamed protein product [Arabis nemorensis]